MTIDKMILLTEGIHTKADKMRVLERSGYARADIARFLGVRYQQVRNTLEGDRRTGYSPAIAPAIPDDASVADQQLKLRTISINEDGFGLLPPDLVDATSDDGDDQLYVLNVRGGLFVTTSAGLVSRAAQTFE